MNSLSQELRQAVIQAAIQGKLTRQLPEDGNATNLLKQIVTEKDKLVKEGIIKKEKHLPGIAADEVPFDIPDNWEWCYFNYLFVVFNGDRGKNYPSKATLQTTGSIPFISAINLNGNNVSVDEKLLYVSDEQYNKLRAGKLMKNDMVMCIRGSLGKHGRFQFDKGAIASSLVIIRPINETYIDSDYLSIYLDSPLLFSEIKRFDNGTAQPNLAAESLKKFMFPLPPLAEQHRIVARVEELMTRIDDLEKTETELEKLKAAFPGDMKAALLQAAMQGKLTEQLPEDGDAADLLKQIVAEKAKLIKEGKIKKDKPLPEITPNEVPFDIPENWKWCRFVDEFNVRSALRIHQSDWKTVGVPFLRGRELVQLSKTGLLKSDVFIAEKFYEELKCKGGIPKKDDVLITAVGTLGKVYVVKGDEGKFYYKDAYILCLENYGLNPYYIKYVLESPLSQSVIYDATSKGTTVAQLTIMKLKGMLIPLPPLAEQKRIVEKLDKLLPLCDGLVEE